VAIGTTELENCTLAMIGQHQPCSAYAVRQAIAHSPTPEWSGSTGSIYPVVERLLRLGLIEAEPQKGDSRGRRNLKITPAGEQAVRAWIADLEPWAAKATPDPIRTRVSFLGQLPSDAERAVFLALAVRLTENALVELKPAVEAMKAVHALEYLAGRGAIHQLRARLRWLRDMLAFYDGASPYGPIAKPVREIRR
jgi:DNA-binding PadR family transcriptional regulator